MVSLLDPADPRAFLAWPIRRPHPISAVVFARFGEHSALAAPTRRLAYGFHTVNILPQQANMGIEPALRAGRGLAAHLHSLKRPPSAHPFVPPPFPLSPHVPPAASAGPVEVGGGAAAAGRPGMCTESSVFPLGDA